jgi:hypothetical protein
MENILDSIVIQVIYLAHNGSNRNKEVYVSETIWYPLHLQFTNKSSEILKKYLYEKYVSVTKKYVFYRQTKINVCCVKWNSLNKKEILLPVITVDQP